jgi:apolipoprotein D and lipocalin family protein
MSFKALGLLAAWIALSATPLAQEAPLRVVPDLDYTRYSGTWYEIARLPNRFQRKCVGDVRADYSLRDDGRLTVTNRCRTEDGTIDGATGEARPVKGQPPSVLEVRFAPAFLTFLPFVWGDYQVIDLGSDYEYAVVGTPDRKYLWILARRPQLDDATYEAILGRAASQGFDTGALIKTSQNVS